jgi:sucrose-phosphate synthase
MMIFDIDDTLIGADRAPLEELQNIIKENEDHIAFGVATGRTIDSAREVLSENNFILPDLIISSVGSEIYYKDKENNYISSRGWEKHISHLWKKEKILNLLDEFDFIELQEDETQRKHKVSYYLDADESKLKDIREKLMKYKIKANLIISHNKFLDILPYRASKGRAVRYQSYRWNIALDNILVAGDSGNDEDMLRGELRAFVVGKHSKELEKLKGRRRIYFAEKAATAGILEGINYYNFLEKEIRW